MTDSVQDKPRDLIGVPSGVRPVPTDDELAGMSHAELYRRRAEAGNDRAAQDKIGPAEHQAFAREWTEESPIIAPLSLAVAIPAYSAAKAVGLTGARSGATMDEMIAGYKGIGQGLKNAISKAIK